MDEKFLIAQVGRTIGLYGDLKLNLHTDFTEQFKVGNSYDTQHGKLQIASYDSKRSLVSFTGYGSIDSAKRLTNTKLFSTLEDTRKVCPLETGQYFWFDIIGSDLYQEDELIGSILDIDRMLNTDYLIVKTDVKLVDEGSSKEFLLPYIPRYIDSVNIDEKRVYAKDAKDILEAS